MDLSGVAQAWAIYQADLALIDAAAKIPDTNLDLAGIDYKGKVIVAFETKVILDLLDVAEKAAIELPVNAFYLLARAFIRRDPLAIDLDGDGIETVGVSAAANMQCACLTPVAATYMLLAFTQRPAATRAGKSPRREKKA